MTIALENRNSHCCIGAKWRRNWNCKVWLLRPWWRGLRSLVLRSRSRSMGNPVLRILCRCSSRILRFGELVSVQLLKCVWFSYYVRFWIFRFSVFTLHTVGVLFDSFFGIFVQNGFVICSVDCRFFFISRKFVKYGVFVIVA